MDYALPTATLESDILQNQIKKDGGCLNTRKMHIAMKRGGVSKDEVQEDGRLLAGQDRGLHRLSYAGLSPDD